MAMISKNYVFCIEKETMSKRNSYSRINVSFEQIIIIIY